MRVRGKPIMHSGAKCLSSRCLELLPRCWVHAPSVPEGVPLRVMHFNVLADCLAISSSVFSPKKGFRCDPEALQWDHRSALLRQELLKYRCDIISLCEVDRYEDFFEPTLSQEGFDGTFQRKRSPARDGVAIFWRRGRLEEGLRRSVFLEHARRTKGAQVALLQRFCVAPQALSSARKGNPGLLRNIVVCATHLRASADDTFRMQQASEVISALKDFSRGEDQIVFADVNSLAPPDAELGGATKSVFEYFLACGYRCAYRSVERDSDQLQGCLPDYTTWAGWASGDFKAVCDHIFVSGPNIHVASVLNMPPSELLSANFPERLPNSVFPSDHFSLVADIVIT